MAKGGEGRKDGRTEGRKDGRLKIPPCVPHDIGPLGPLPKNGLSLPALGKKKLVIQTSENFVT